MGDPDPGLDAALRALVEPNRRAILALVRREARSVGEICEAVPMSQQAVSHHLRVLRTAGLVTERRAGTRHLFLVRPEGFDLVRDYLAQFWTDHLDRLKLAAERHARPGPGPSLRPPEEAGA